MLAGVLAIDAPCAARVVVIYGLVSLASDAFLTLSAELML